MMATLGLKAYDELRRMLMHGQLEPGMQLVNRKLADAIGMSMTPVREAVTRLASEGLVEHVPGAGAFVRRMTRQDLAQLYDVREALEPVAAAQAALYATPLEIDELRGLAGRSFAIIRQIAAAKEKHADQAMMDDWLADEQRFHEVVFEAARNRWLSKIAADMKLMAFGFSPQRRIPSFLTLPAAVTTWRSHRRLIRAIAARDGDSAAEIVRQHVQTGRREVFGYLEANDADPAMCGSSNVDAELRPSRRGRKPSAKRLARSPRKPAAASGGKAPKAKPAHRKRVASRRG